MNPEYKHLIPVDFANNSKVWIYQSSRLFSMTEALQIEAMLKSFIKSWKSHGADVKGFATLIFGRFILIMADEEATGVSGCSTDSSVRLIKEIEHSFEVSMFDRSMLVFYKNGKFEVLPLNQLNYAYENGFIQDDTLYFNNLVGTKAGLNESWVITLQQSWLMGRIRKLKTQ